MHGMEPGLVMGAAKGVIGAGLKSPGEASPDPAHAAPDQNTLKQRVLTTDRQRHGLEIEHAHKFWL